MWTQVISSALPAFLASLVEFVEALTIVLAVGVTRGWRPALLGTTAGVVVLSILVLIFGPSLALVPLNMLQLVIGILLLLFGLRWLRKAVLRAAGVVALHDETRIFERQRNALLGNATTHAVDALGFVTSFKAVVIEGIEVVFIVIAVGAAAGALVPAAIGALVAGVIVVSLGLLIHRPLARVPENALKFIVGILLSAFGTFWTGEAFGTPWPAADASLLCLIAGYAIIAGIATSISRPRESLVSE